MTDQLKVLHTTASAWRVPCVFRSIRLSTLSRFNADIRTGMSLPAWKRVADA